MKHCGIPFPEGRRFDCTCLGAVNVRATPLPRPGYGFTPWSGTLGAVFDPCGAELNLLASMGYIYNLRTRFVTGLPMGHALVPIIKERVRGMNAHLDPYWFKMNPLGRPGISMTYTNFPFDGFADRVTYDRDGEAAQCLKPEHHDWDEIMSSTRLFHTGGLYAFLNPKLVLHAAEKANEHGVPMSFDPNWRQSLVNWRCETDGCTEEDVRDHLRAIVSKTTVLCANVNDPVDALGITKPDERRVRAFFDSADQDEFIARRGVFEGMIREIAKKFSSLKIIAMQLRREQSVHVHNWCAVAYATETDEFAWATHIATMMVQSRAGGGDGFAGALESNLLQGIPLADCVNEGFAGGALVAKCPTDITLATHGDIAASLSGTSAKIER